MKIPIVCIVGKTDSGKTTFIEKLIPSLKQLGLRVGAVKHDVHGFEIDYPGKDSWRFGQAGADTYVVSSPSSQAIVKKRDRDATLGEITPLFEEEVDIVLAEGYKREEYPKIEISGRNNEKRLCSDEELIALVSDVPSGEETIPVFGQNEAEKVAQFLQESFVKKGKKPSISLVIKGKPVSLNEFAQKSFSRTLLGYISALKDIEELKDPLIKISIFEKKK